MKAVTLFAAALLAGCASHVRMANMTPADLAEQSSMDLCQSYHWTTSKGTDRPDVRAELERREALTAEEWKLAESHEVRIGMSEVALMCAWGHPGPPCGSIDESVSSQGTTRKWVYRLCSYGKTQYVYTENGVVIEHHGVDWQN